MDAPVLTTSPARKPLDARAWLLLALVGLLMGRFNVVLSSRRCRFRECWQIWLWIRTQAGQLYQCRLSALPCQTLNLQGQDGDWTFAHFAVSPDGKQAALSDNNGGRVLLLSPAGAVQGASWRIMRRMATSWARLHSRCRTPC